MPLLSQQETKRSGIASLFLPGKWLGDDAGMAYGTEPSSDGQIIIEFNRDLSSNGYIAPEIMLQICDGRSDCDFVLEEELDHTHSVIEFLKRDSDKIAYVHRNKCDSGMAINVTAPLSGGVYKKCTNTWDHPQALGSFTLPPFLCAQSCDQNPLCTMFTVNQAGNLCWLSNMGSHNGGAVYFKIADA